MANWKLRELRGERRRNFLKMCGVAAAGVGIERSRLLNFLADEGGHGLAEAGLSSFGRALIVPAPNGSFAWFTQLWHCPDPALKAHQSVAVPASNIPNFFGSVANFQTIAPFLYTPAQGFAPPDDYRGTYVPGKGNGPASAPGIKNWLAGDRPFFYGPTAPWFDHAAGVPKYPVTALMTGVNETHEDSPATPLALSSKATLEAALASLGAYGSTAPVPALGITSVRYGRAPGSPRIVTAPSAATLVNLFDSAASQFTLKDTQDQESFSSYYKALLGLRPSTFRSSSAPQMEVTKKSAKLLGLNFAAQLTPTLADLQAFGLGPLLEFPMNQSSTAYIQRDQVKQLLEFGRSLVVIAKAFALGLSKTAIVSLSAGATSDTFFVDPHSAFDSPQEKVRSRNTVQHLSKILDAFYAYLAGIGDPENPGETLASTTAFVAYGDTPKTPYTPSAWPDGTPQNSNWLYLMDPGGRVKNGWLGNVSVMRTQGLNAWGYDPMTGADALGSSSGKVSAYSSAAAVYAVARGDKNKVVDYGVSANLFPGLIKG